MVAMNRRPLQWELSEAEREAAYAVEGDWTASTMAKTLARAPRLIPKAVNLGLRAAVRGIWSDVELGVLLDSERVRQALPGTVRGAAWGPDHTFLDALLPCLTTDADVLEIGCGVGRISRQVAPKVGELVCSDVSGVMIREAKVHLAEFPNVRCMQTKGYWLEGVPDASFDVVYAHAVFVFFDLYPAIAMLDATRRVLRDGGTAIIGFITMDRPDWAEETVVIARRSARRGTFGGRALRPYTEAQIRAMCEAVGLEVADCGYGATTASDLRAHLIVTAKATQRRPVSSQPRTLE
jgi:ubiquinone/menaquinone biosynthesis C-methylase UbiE